MTNTRALPEVDLDLPAAEVLALAEGLDHVGDEHADTVLLVARALGGRPEVTTAEIVGVDGGGLRMAVLVGGVPTGMEVPFAGPARTAHEVYTALVGLVGAARAVVGDSVPLTSLEDEVVEAAQMITVPGTVARSRMLAPNLMEVTLTGLDRLPRTGGDEYVTLVVDPAADLLRPGFTINDLAGMPPETVPRAAYTLRSRRGVEADVWVVLHGDEGRVSSRLAAAGPGVPVGLWGTRRTYSPPEGVGAHLLVCDETALGAVAAVLDELPAGHPAVVVAETVDPDHQVPLPERPGVEIRWVHRDGAAAGTGTALLDGVRAALADGGALTDRAGVFAFGAGETAAMRAVRDVLRRDAGLARDRVRLTGYWRRGAGHPGDV